MVKKLISSSSNFNRALGAYLSATEESDAAIAEKVRGVIKDTRVRGDTAILEYTRRFDNWSPKKGADLCVTEKERKQALRAVSKEVRVAIAKAAARIGAYHKKQMPRDLAYKDTQGTMLGWRWIPIDRAGLYVPGGKAAYPSSVLMNAMPALVAGVKDISIVVPAPGGVLNPGVIAAADEVGITQLYKIGGAQAVAALAYGTATIPAVDKIVGPGNAYVAEAKRQVFGKVGIDMIAGPSEILVIADTSANPEWVAADLLSQAEHDERAQSILITDNDGFANAVEEQIAALLEILPRQKIAATSWRTRGLIVLTKNLSEAAEIANRIAPEHLELMVKNPEQLAKKIRHAGAIFFGHYTPEAFGDYMAGPSHVLPTSGSARFSSGLGVFDFLKRTSLIGASPKAARTLAKHTIDLAESEGLGAHALSMRLRAQKD